MQRVIWALTSSFVFCACDVSTATDGSDQDYEQEVLHRASIEFECAPSDIVITEIDHYTYLAEGCGYRATYECGIVSSETNGPNPCLRAPALEPEDSGAR